MFPSILFEWPDFCDAELFAIVSKADEILNCIVEPLLDKNYDQTRNLGHYFNHYLDEIPTSHGIVSLEDRIFMPPQLRAPVLMRLHQVTYIHDQDASCRKQLFLVVTYESVNPTQRVLFQRTCKVL